VHLPLESRVVLSFDSELAYVLAVAPLAALLALAQVTTG
jgi:hypothetical protein